MGISANPLGGSQFAGGASQGAPAFARAERAVDFSGSSLWTVTADISARGSNGSESAGSYPGALNLDNAASGEVVAGFLGAWDSTAVGSTWSLIYSLYDAGGTSLFQTAVGEPAWAGLAQGQWYRAGMAIDLGLNQIVQVTIQSLTGGPTSIYHPSGWYLRGGAGGPSGLDAIRLFAGNQAGNMYAVDNISIQQGAVPEPGTLLTLSGGLALLLALARRRKAS